MNRLAILLAALVALLAVAPSAMASTRDKIIKDCADDGQLQGKYSQSQLRDARQNLPSDVAEYTDCADVLRRAELPGNGGGGSGGSGGSSTDGGSGTEATGDLTPSNPDEQKALDDAYRTGKTAIDVNGEKVVPGATGLSPQAARNGIPSTLVAVLVLLGLGGLALAVPGLRRTLPFFGHRRG